MRCNRVVARLAAETGMERTWVGLGPTVTHERVVADSGGVAAPRPASATHAVLQRDREEGAATWTRIRAPARRRTRHAEPQGTTRRAASSGSSSRSADETIGSLWAQRADSAGQPAARGDAAPGGRRGPARPGGAPRAPRRRRRRSSRSRAAATSSRARSSTRCRTTSARRWRPSARQPAASPTRRSSCPTRSGGRRRRRSTPRRIAERLVGDLLDMSRIQGGALVADIEVIPLDELVQPVSGACSGRSGCDRPIDLDLPPDLPERARRRDPPRPGHHQPARERRELRGRRRRRSGCMALPKPDATVSLVVEDGGAGRARRGTCRRSSSASTASHRRPTGARRGFGLGLVGRAGLVEAMGGSVIGREEPPGRARGHRPLPAEPAEPGRRMTERRRRRSCSSSRTTRRRAAPSRRTSRGMATASARRRRRGGAAPLGAGAARPHPARPWPARESTGSRSSATCGATRPRRSSCSRRATRSATRSRRSTPAPTTT